MRMTKTPRFYLAWFRSASSDEERLCSLWAEDEESALASMREFLRAVDTKTLRVEARPNEHETYRHPASIADGVFIHANRDADGLLTGESSLT